MKKILLLAVASCMMLVATVAFAQEALEVKEVSAEEPKIHEEGFQLSFITPLGTNWLDSHLTINTVSLNLLGGYSYGNTALELGGLYNINTNMTKGAQFAGIANYSGNAYSAIQFAGVTNIAADGVISAQFGGVLNVAKDVSGAQIAGAINITKDVNGAQIGGVLNIAKDVSGAQIGSVLNVAKKLEGLQFGLINYADESDGLSIGLINIIKNGGKQEFEVSFSEAINTAVSFRLGTDKFYTIFSGGINYFTTPEVEFATGLGFGTHIDWAKGWGNQIEVMGYQMTEDGTFTKGINMLTQLKFTVSKEIAKRFKVFAGPVLNLTISDYENSEGQLGSSVAPWVMWKNDSDKIRLNGWVGFVAGVRF